MTVISEKYVEFLKEGFLEAIQDEVQHFLNDHGGGKAMMPFSIGGGESDIYNYFLVEDLDDHRGFDKLEELTDKYLAEFEPGDHLFILINGNTVKAVKFYIAKGLMTLSDAIEYYGTTVGLDHLIFSRYGGDSFKLDEAGKKIFYHDEKKS